MQRVMEMLFGRVPVGWMQLRHNPTRLIAAAAGVMFATVLVFIQVGFYVALVDSIGDPYRIFNADIVIRSPASRTLTTVKPLPRQRLYQALTVEGVESGASLYIGQVFWFRDDGVASNMRVFGMNPQEQAFLPSKLSLEDRQNVKILDQGMIDSRGRRMDQSIITNIIDGKPYQLEVNHRMLTLVGAIGLGGGFEADGHLIVSDQTFLKLYPNRDQGSPDLLFIKAKPGVNVKELAQKIRAILPESDSQVFTLQQLIDDDTNYQTGQRPVGVVLGFGMWIGVLVGMIIVYQVLSTDVADHMKEYATFKAIGYPPYFFVGILFEEALVLALFGFFPGYLISIQLYHFAGKATDLPLAMTTLRVLLVLFGTVFTSVISGLIASRKLRSANPADLF